MERWVFLQLTSMRVQALFSLANCVTCLYNTLFFNTDADKSDDQCLIIHCVSFVVP